MSADSLAAARRVLTDTFGHPEFRSGQEQVVSTVLSGRDSLVIMPTGGGKSLCYQLPALVSDGVTLVISPLIALMKDQVDTLEATGIPAAAINSSLSFDAVQAVIARVRRGELKLLYVAPERFDSRYFMEAMAGVTVARVAVDEAHCISQWGHDFRPAYLRLTAAIERLGRPPIVALTATATPTVQDDIAFMLGLNDPARFVTGFDRDNLHLAVQPGGKKKDTLARFMANNPGPGIVYCATRRRVDEAASQLSEQGIAAVAYHAGIPPERRDQAQESFLNGKIPIIVATNAFGMGIDKADVRFVLHYDMPGTLEAYYQEAGRAGRDGLDAACTILYGGGDRFTQEFFVNASYPTEAFIRELWRILPEVANGDVVELSHRGLLERTGMEGSEMGVSSALKILEEANTIVRLNPRTNPSTIRLIDRGKVSERAQVQLQLLHALEFMLPPGENGTVQVPVGQLAEDAAIDHEQALRALNAMAAAGAIDYTPPFRGRGLRILTGELPEIDFSQVEAKRRFALDALDAMERYCRTSSCRRALILAHFGETGAPDCGGCDRCQAGVGEKPVESTELARKLLSGVARCRGRNGSTSFGVQTVAAHLTGGNTEAIRRNGLDKVSTHGLLQHYKQRQVADLLGELITQGLLRREDAGQGGSRRPVLMLTASGLSVLKGERDGILLTPPAAPEPSTARAQNNAAAIADLNPDPELFTALKTLRTQLSKAEDIPPFRVFPDRALNEMADKMPRDDDAFLAINGVGPSKLERYGKQFLQVIAAHQQATTSMEAGS